MMSAGCWEGGGVLGVGVVSVGARVGGVVCYYAVLRSRTVWLLL